MLENILDVLIRDNKAMRKAGCNLAEAAIRVINEHDDGIHKLSKAVSEWAEVIANEGRKAHLDKGWVAHFGKEGVISEDWKETMSHFNRHFQKITDEEKNNGIINNGE